MSVSIAPLMKLYSLLNLLENRLIRSTVIGMESSIVAIGTPACPNSSVTVWTSETGINNYLLQPASIFLPEISGK